MVNAESTLGVSEKRFFHKVKAAVSRPKNIFIEYNRWDCVDEEVADCRACAPSPAQTDTHMIERARAQHFKNASTFLLDELQLGDESTLTSRVFFLSAKEALARRLGARTSTLALPPAAEDRYRCCLSHSLMSCADADCSEFLRFESSFEECISTTAIQTRFAGRIDEAVQARICAGTAPRHMHV